MSVDQRPEAPPGPFLADVGNPAPQARDEVVDDTRRIDRLTRRGLRLARFTVAYNLVEAGVAITAGVLAGLVSVVGLGIDAGIESVAGVLIALRLAARLRRGETDARKELRTLRMVAVAFFALAGYMTVEGIRVLASGATPERSPLAIGLLVVSLVVMPLLAGAKRRVGVALNDPLILSDAAETRVGILLSVSTLLGLVVFVLTGAAWVDALAGFVVAAFAIHEGLEAWTGELGEERHLDPAAEAACED